LPFNSVHDYVAAMLDGKTVSGNFRKVPGYATTANWWFDLSMASGNPPANFYASTPLFAQVLSRWDSIFHGDNQAPSEMYLHRLYLATSGAGMVGEFKLCDYLLYYPFIDMDSTDQQDLNNAVALPRYTTGEGVLPVAISQAPSTGSGQFTFRYVNQSGITRTSPVQTGSSSPAQYGSVITGQPASAGQYGPFLTLAYGDTGVRQILSLTNISSNGGLCAIALVKPLLDIPLREASTPMELELLTMRSGAIRIYDGAFLGFLAQTGASVASVPLVGQFDYVWT
jgi:hypothetical protein